jgi:hypothetical protein
MTNAEAAAKPAITSEDRGHAIVALVVIDHSIYYQFLL